MGAIVLRAHAEVPRVQLAPRARELGGLEVRAAASIAQMKLHTVLGSPLDGVPVLLKDNIGTDDMPTTAGSIALEGSVPDTDAFLVERLRAGHGA